MACYPEQKYINMRKKLLSVILMTILAMGCWSCKKSKDAEVAKGDVQVMPIF